MVKANTVDLAGVLYLKIGREEKIPENAMHTLDGIRYCPLYHKQTVGMTPSEFSPDRDFYKPIIPLKSFVRMTDDGEGSGYSWVVYGEDAKDVPEGDLFAMNDMARRYAGPGLAFTSEPVCIRKKKRTFLYMYFGLDI